MCKTLDTFIPFQLLSTTKHKPLFSSLKNPYPKKDDLSYIWILTNSLMLTGDSFHYFIFNISLDNFKSLVYDIYIPQKIEFIKKRKQINV